jgi:hypothetical protein
MADPAGRSLYDELVDTVRSQSVMQLACTGVFLLPAALLGWAAVAVPDTHPALSTTLALLVTLAAGMQFYLARQQLRTIDPDQMASRLANQPPVLISVQITQTPIMQALDVLSCLRSDHQLTRGNPCTPRLLIQLVDADGRPVDPQKHESVGKGSRRLGTTHEFVREPLQFTQARIRQVVKDPRSLNWEENAALDEMTRSKQRRPSSESSSTASGDVHDFITANYGNAERVAGEGALQSVGEHSEWDLSSHASPLGHAARSIRPPFRPTHGLAMPLEPPLVKEARSLLDGAIARGEDAWNFDAFSLKRVTNDHALVFTGYHLLKHEGIQKHFGISDAKLLAFLQRLEDSYTDNPYHNRSHAADVLQATWWILNASDEPEQPEYRKLLRANSLPSHASTTDSAVLTDGVADSLWKWTLRNSKRGGAGMSGAGGAGGGVGSQHRKKLRSLLEPEDLLAVLVAALAHDVGHTGQNNAFHVSSSSELAIFYNDKSVLENHHCARLFQVLKDPACDLFASLGKAQRREVRDMIVTMILGTDMGVHFKNVDRLKATIEAGSFDLSNKEDKTFVLEIVLHAADISNPCRPEPVYRLWTDKVMEEFYNQGDAEKAASLPVSKFFDRDTPNVPRCQVGFITFVLMPLYTALSDILDIGPLMTNLKHNLAIMECAAEDKS